MLLLRGARLDADLAELLLEQRDVVRECLQELLRVQRSENHATVDLHVRPAWYDAAEIDDELAGRVNDVGEIHVFALRDLIVECDANRLLLLIFHSDALNSLTPDSNSAP